MFTSSFRFGAFLSLIPLVVACGGSTSSDTPPGGAGAGGASAGSGASAGTAGSGASAGTAGSAASAGTAGAGAAGSPAYSACAAPGDCVLGAVSCCGQCGAPTPGDMLGLNHAKASDYRASVCQNAGCPACMAETSPDLVAVCRKDACAAVEVHQDPLSACETDADCRLYPANECCDCAGGIPADKYIALAKQGLPEYQANVCGPGVGGCKTNCASAPPPPSLSVTCDQATKHCKVVKSSPPKAACPSSIPKDGAPCGALETDECEYGDNVNIGCRIHAQCMKGKWVVGLTGCPPTPGPGQAGCPNDTSVDGSTCASDGLLCDMGGGASCLCAQCVGPCSTEAGWHCAKPPTSPCAKTAPNVGQPCTEEGLSCAYGVACSQTGATRVCKGGLWHDETLACPL